MTIPGKIQNGVVVLESNLLLPEGMAVTVTVPLTGDQNVSKPPQKISLPLVPSKRPGSRRLTADRVAELLEAEDVSPRR